MNGKRLKIPIIILIAIISLGHFFTPGGELSLHNIQRHLYIIPILISGLYLGLRGGLTASLIISILYFPHFILQAPLNFHTGNIVQIMLFNLVGYLSGSYADSVKNGLNDTKILNSHPVALGKGFLYWVDDSQLAVHAARWVSDYMDCIKAPSITLLWVQGTNQPLTFRSERATGDYPADLEDEVSSHLEKIKMKMVHSGYPEREIHKKIITCNPDTEAVECVLRELSSGHYTGIFAMKHYTTKLREFLFGDDATDLIRHSLVPVIVVKGFITDE